MAIFADIVVQDVVKVEMVPHLNTVMLHLFLFNLKYHLIEEKELELVTDLQEGLLSHLVGDVADDGTSNGAVSSDV